MRRQAAAPRGPTRARPAGRAGTTSADDLSAGIPSRRFARSRAGAIRPGLAPRERGDARWSDLWSEDRGCLAPDQRRWGRERPRDGADALPVLPQRLGALGIVRRERQSEVQPSQGAYRLSAGPEAVLRHAVALSSGTHL